MVNIGMFMLEWSGTALILAGIFYLASESANEPETRLKGFIVAIIGCSLLGIFGFLISAYGVMITQIGVIIIDIRGIYNCRKEIELKNLAKQVSEEVLSN